MTESMTQPAPTPSRSRWLIRLLSWGACAVVLWFVGAALWKQFRQVSWSDVHFDPALTSLAVACVFAISGMQLIARWTLLLAYGYPLSWRIQLPAAWVPQIGKYIPGGIASVGGAVILLRKFGVPAAIGFSVAVLLDALAVIAGLIVSTPLLLMEPMRSKYPAAAVACVAMVVIGLVMLHPRVFVGLLNAMLRVIRRQPIAEVPPAHRYLWPVLASFGQWVFAGLALWFLLASLTSVTLSVLPLCIAVAALAMTVSYLTPFSPAGLGVREGIFLLVLSPMFPVLEHPKIAIAVVAMRIVQTLIEILLAIVGLLLLRGQNDPRLP